MRLRDRILHVAMAFLLPAICLASMLAFTIASVRFGESDRAIIWAEGNELQLQELANRVAGNEQFPDGRHAEPSAPGQSPEGCGPGAREFSIGSLRVEEAQAARLLLEALAAETGARVCLTNVFVIGELPSAAAGRHLADYISGVLRSLLLPCGIALAVYFMFSGQFGLKLHSPNYLPRLQGAALVIGCALLAWLIAAVPGTLDGTANDRIQGSPVLAMPAIGLSLTFALAVASPFLNELAFRAWMLPLVERAIGTFPGALLSTLIYASAQAPGSLGEWTVHVAQGGIYSMLFLRTRSLLACACAHGLCSSATLFVAAA